MPPDSAPKEHCKLLPIELHNFLAVDGVGVFAGVPVACTPPQPDTSGCPIQLVFVALQLKQGPGQFEEVHVYPVPYPVGVGAIGLQTPLTHFSFPALH